MILTTYTIAEFKYKLELTSVPLCASSDMLMGDLYLYKIFNMQIKFKKNKKGNLSSPLQNFIFKFQYITGRHWYLARSILCLHLCSEMQISNKELRERIYHAYHAQSQTP